MNEHDVPERGAGAFFRSELLPRWRALLAVAGFAAALLAAGGMLEYSSGSPAIGNTPVATYWAWFFALNTVAFGGTALLAGFPRLGSAAVKLAWLGALVLLYGLGFRVWYGQQPDTDGVWQAWWLRSSAYLPAAVAALIGLALPARTGVEPSESPSSGQS